MARSEGDSWDLASSVGATATSVAASRALASRGPDPLIDDPYAATLVDTINGTCGPCSNLIMVIPITTIITISGITAFQKGISFSLIIIILPIPFVLDNFK